MGFNQQWDETFRNNAHMSIWPWSDLVSYVMRYAKPDQSSFKVLEVGCGAGANIPFFNKLGVDYFGIDGSSYIVNLLKETYPELSDRLACADFTEQLYFPDMFDLIIDRGGITCNDTASIQRCMDLIYKQLKPEGKFIGIDWYSSAHSEFSNGQATADPYTKTFDDGPMASIGGIHFSDQSHLTELLSRFKILVLEHKEIKRAIPDENHIFASWNIAAVKS
jgi:SAM-dependent methyltransferase